MTSSCSYSHHKTRSLTHSIMNAFSLWVAIAMAVVVAAEPPSGYSYSRPSGGGGYSGGGGGHSGGYQQEPVGYQTNEGATVDPVLLEKVRQIVLKEEIASQSTSVGGGGGGGVSSSYGAPSPQYGVPSTTYGVPGYRIIGVDLEGIKQAIQVAQYNQISYQSFGGYPSSTYGAPSSRYGAPF